MKEHAPRNSFQFTTLFEINLCVYVVFTFNELNCFQGLNSEYNRKLPNAYLVNHLIYIVQLVVLFLKFIMFCNDIYLNIYNDYCLWSQYD